MQHIGMRLWSACYNPSSGLHTPFPSRFSMLEGDVRYARRAAEATSSGESARRG